MKYARTLVVLVLLGVFGERAMAFPHQYFAAATVYPWVPTPVQRVVVTFSDSLLGSIPADGAGVEVASVSTKVEGFIITVSAKLVPNPTASSFLTIPVDLGALPPGRYLVRYSSDGLSEPYLHQASVSFSVVETGLATAVEFFNVGLGHYFISADPGEIDKLDSRAIRGWSRTGGSFHVMSPETMPTTATPVCRFYGPPSAGLDSHFFSASTHECADVQLRWPSQWLLETPAAFGIAYTAETGYCGTDAQALYRLYNNRADANHRYTTSTAVRDVMMAQGWILEGSAYGNTSRDFIAMCIPR